MKRLLLIGLLFSPFGLAIETNTTTLDEAYSGTLAQTERVMGQMIMQQIYGSELFLPDHSVNEYLKSFANRFETYVPIRPHFFAINTPELNAFTFFGGHVAVHSGLMLAVNNESELAAVLAHETAHITQHHLERILIMNKKMLPVTFAEVLAAIAIGTFGSPDAGVHLVTAALAGHAQNLINFTREHEKEADRIGMQLLAKSEYDPNAMATVFDRMQKNANYREAPPEYLLTHPLFDSRIADAQNRAQQYPSVANHNPFLFYLIRARLRANEESASHKRLSRFEHNLTSQTYENQDAERYGYALALIKANRLPAAQEELIKLSERYPNEWLIDLSLAELAMEQQQFSLALTRTEKLLKKHPTNYAILLQHATALLKTQQPEAVIKLLFHYRKSADDPSVYPLLAQAYQRLGKKTDVHRMQAEWHFARGESKKAIAQLEIALEQAEPGIKLTIEQRKAFMLQTLDEQSKIRL